VSEFDSSEAAQLGLEFLSNVEPMIETLKGYRAKLVEAGFGETAAECMVVDMHRKILLG
jgi:hypothetical protein